MLKFNTQNLHHGKLCSCLKMLSIILIKFVSKLGSFRYKVSLLHVTLFSLVSIMVELCSVLKFALSGNQIRTQNKVFCYKASLLLHVTLFSLVSACQHILWW